MAKRLSPAEALLSTRREYLYNFNTGQLISGDLLQVHVTKPTEDQLGHWIVHNHPSGPLEPSYQDLKIARAMRTPRFDIVFPKHGVVLRLESPTGGYPLPVNYEEAAQILSLLRGSGHYNWVKRKYEGLSVSTIPIKDYPLFQSRDYPMTQQFGNNPTLFHGASELYDKPDPSYFKHGAYGRAFYLTDREQTAREYAQLRIGRANIRSFDVPDDVPDRLKFLDLLAPVSVTELERLEKLAEKGYAWRIQRLIERARQGAVIDGEEVYFGIAEWHDTANQILTEAGYDGVKIYHHYDKPPKWEFAVFPRSVGKIEQLSVKPLWNPDRRRGYR